MTITRSSLRRVAALSLTASALSAASAHADIVSWTSPNSGVWQHAWNWTPHAPQADDYVLIGAAGPAENRTVTMNDHVADLAAIVISDGMVLDTSGYRLIAPDALVRIMGENFVDNTYYTSTLNVPDSGNGDDLRVDEISIEDDARLYLQSNSRVRVLSSLATDDTGRIVGAGSIVFDGDEGVALDNNGRLNAGLTLVQNGAARLDLDGTSEDGTIRGITVHADMLADPFNSYADVFNETLAMHVGDGWMLGPDGRIQMQSLFGDAAVAGSPVILQGQVLAYGDEALTFESDLFMFGGEVEVDATQNGYDSHLTIEGDVLGTGGRFFLDGDVTLEFVGAFGAVSTDFVLGGGTVIGSQVHSTSGATILGHGSFEARLVNDGRVAGDGGVLEVHGLINDWDGPGGEGELCAETGSLHLTEVGNPFFGGAMRVANDHEIFVDGFRFTMTQASSLSLAGGTLRSDETQRIGGTVGVTGAATLDTDAELLATSTLSIHGDLVLKGRTRWHAGVTSFGTGTLVTAPSGWLTLDDGALVNMDVVSNGALIVADGVGAATIDGDFANHGILVMQIADTQSYDRLMVEDELALQGVIGITLLGADPQAGDAFDLIDFGSWAQGFYEWDLPLVAPQYQWDRSDFETTGILRVIDDTCLADINDDGTVDFQDVLSVLAKWGTDDAWNDLDEDDLVGFSDLIIVLAAWGDCV